MPPLRRRGSLLIAACAVIVLLLVVMPRGAAAQVAPSLEIGPPSHRADGTIVAPLIASDAAAASLIVLVDGAPVPFAVTNDGVESRNRVVFLIENSVSMTAFQLADLRAGMSGLVALLSPTDEVGIVTFGGSAAVLLPLTTDRNAFDTAMNEIGFGGGSALFSGIVTATDVLADDGSPALIVVATYGWDWGGLSAHSREASASAVADSGAAVYVQSLVFDGLVDVAYLAPLATDGLIHGAAELALLANARSLVPPAGASRTLTVTAPPLAQGTHELRVTSEAGDDQLATFEVTNASLLSIELRPGAEAADPIGGLVRSASGLDGLTITASLSGSPLAVAADGSFEIDPWLFEDGARSLIVTASVGGNAASEVKQQITIPALTPRVNVVENGDGVLVATALVQPGHAGELVAVFKGAVVARTETSSLEIEPPNGDVTFELRSADGTVLASREVSADNPPGVENPPSTGASDSAGSSIWSSPTMLGALLGLAAVAAALALQRRRMQPSIGDDGVATLKPEEPPEADREPAPEPIALPVQDEATAEVPTPVAVPAAVDREPPAPTPIRSSDWTLMVRAADGPIEQFAVGYEPVSIGTSKLCTVTLQDDALRFVHLVIAREGQGLTEHQFGPVRVEGKEQSIEDEHVLTNAVMEIGGVSIWLEPIAVESATAI